MDVWPLSIEKKDNGKNLLIIFDDESKFNPDDKGEMHRMPVGEKYYIDTTKHHTAINGGIPERIHLLGTVTGPC